MIFHSFLYVYQRVSSQKYGDNPSHWNHQPDQYHPKDHWLFNYNNHPKNWGSFSLIIPKIIQNPWTNPQFCHWTWSVQAFAPRWLWVAPWPTRRTRRSWRNAAWPRENSISDGFGWRFPRERCGEHRVWMWRTMPGWWFGTMEFYGLMVMNGE